LRAAVALRRGNRAAVSRCRLSWPRKNPGGVGGKGWGRGSAACCWLGAARLPLPGVSLTIWLTRFPSLFASLALPGGSVPHASKPRRNLWAASFGLWRAAQSACLCPVLRLPRWRDRGCQARRLASPMVGCRQHALLSALVFRQWNTLSLSLVAMRRAFAIQKECFAP